MGARAGNRRFRRLSALRAYTKAPYKPGLLLETLRPRDRPGRAGPDRVPERDRVVARRAVRPDLLRRKVPQSPVHPPPTHTHTTTVWSENIRPPHRVVVRAVDGELGPVACGEGGAIHGAAIAPQPLLVSIRGSLYGQNAAVQNGAAPARLRLAEQLLRPEPLRRVVLALYEGGEVITP